MKTRLVFARFWLDVEYAFNASERPADETRACQPAVVALRLDAIHGVPSAETTNVRETSNPLGPAD